MKSALWIGIVAAMGLATSATGIATGEPEKLQADAAVKNLDQQRGELRDKLKQADKAVADAERKAAEQADANPAPGPLAGFGLAAGLGLISLNDPDVSDVVNCPPNRGKSNPVGATSDCEHPEIAPSFTGPRQQRVIPRSAGGGRIFEAQEIRLAYDGGRSERRRTCAVFFPSLR